MAVELDHPFPTPKPIGESFAAILDLERLVPCVEGGTVLETTGPNSVRAEIKVKMGAMSLNFTATVVVGLRDGGGTIHTNAQITGKAASMGEGVVVAVLDALIKDFAGRLAEI